jgi:hypothetical protein
MWCDNPQLSTSELKDTMRNYALERFLNDFLSAVYLRDNNKVVMETFLIQSCFNWSYFF